MPLGSDALNIMIASFQFIGLIAWGFMLGSQPRKRVESPLGRHQAQVFFIGQRAAGYMYAHVCIDAFPRLCRRVINARITVSLLLPSRFSYDLLLLSMLTVLYLTLAKILMINELSIACDGNVHRSIDKISGRLRTLYYRRQCPDY